MKAIRRHDNAVRLPKGGLCRSKPRQENSKRLGKRLYEESDLSIGLRLEAIRAICSK